MNYIFITIICVICFFALLGALSTMQKNREVRKTIEAICFMYTQIANSNNPDIVSDINGDINNILKAVSAKKSQEKQSL